MFLKKVSIRTRLTLLFVSIFGTTLIVFGFVTFNFLAKSLQKEFDDALYNYSIDVSESVILNPSAQSPFNPADVDNTKIYPFSLGTALIQIRHLNGVILHQVGDFGSFDLPYKEDFKKLARGEDVVFRTLEKVEGLPQAEASTYRLINFPLDNSPVPQLILQIAVPRAFVEAQISSRLILFETGIPVVILIATLAGFFLSSRAMKPVQYMIQKAHEIGATELSQRLPVPEAKDEIRGLALTLNEMLDRIEQSFQSQERFVADASHQLLTPLTIMKGELEQSLKTAPPDTAPVVTSSLRSSLQEADHLIALVKNLLLLARVDAGLGAMNLQELYFDEVVMDALSRAEKIARPREIGLKFNIQNLGDQENFRPKVLGDEDLLQTLVFNLLENAVKYSKDGSTVAVSLEWNWDQQTLSLKDSGPGLPPDQLEMIFERFSRAQPQVDGYGLGLAIAKKIAMIHRADLRAENRHDQTGSVFQVSIKNI